MAPKQVEPVRRLTGFHDKQSSDSDAGPDVALRGPHQGADGAAMHDPVACWLFRIVAWLPNPHPAQRSSPVALNCCPWPAHERQRWLLQPPHRARRGWRAVQCSRLPVPHGPMLLSRV